VMTGRVGGNKGESAGSWGVVDRNWLSSPPPPTRRPACSENGAHKQVQYSSGKPGAGWSAMAESTQAEVCDAAG